MAEYLIEFEARVDAAGTIVTQLFHSGAGFNKPGGLGFYQPWVKSPLEFRRSLFSSAATSGSVATGVGGTDLVNVSGGLDAIAGYGLAGGKLTVKMIEPGATYASAVTLAVLTMEQPVASFDTLSLRVRDRLYELEKRLLQTTVYAGSNSLPNGVEGVTGDLKGITKPILYGRARNIPAILVNSSRNIYQISTAAVFDITTIYDNAAATPISLGAVYTSQSDMETNVPAAGTARIWKAGGMFRLGSNAFGLITCDAIAGATAADRTVAQILQAMATGPGAIAGGDIVAADVTALDAANSTEVGIWVDAEISVRSAMEQIANSIGAWFGFDRLGRLRMKRFEAPSGSPVATLRFIRSREAAAATEFNILEIERVASEDEGRGVPPWRAILTYQPIYAVQTGDLATSVTPDRRGYLAQRVRQVTSDAAAVLTQFPGAGKRTYETLLDDATAAQTEADRLRDLHKVLRNIYSVTIKFGSAQAALIDLGSVISLKIDRFGLSAGKLHTVIGIDYDAANDTAKLELWG